MQKEFLVETTARGIVRMDVPENISGEDLFELLEKARKNKKIQWYDDEHIVEIEDICEQRVYSVD